MTHHYCLVCRPHNILASCVDTSSAECPSPSTLPVEIMPCNKYQVKGQDVASGLRDITAFPNSTPNCPSQSAPGPRYLLPVCPLLSYLSLSLIVNKYLLNGTEIYRTEKWEGLTNNLWYAKLCGYITWPLATWWFQQETSYAFFLYRTWDLLKKGFIKDTQQRH